MKKFYADKIYPYVRIMVLGAMIMSVIISCKKDNNSMMIIQHDDSKMMSLLHAMVASMDSLTLTNDPDHDFAMLMRMHNRGSIAMGMLELTEGNDPFVQEMAGQMISYRKEEIAALDSFLVSHVPVINNSRFRQEAETIMAIMSNNADLQLLNGYTDHDFAVLLIQHHMSAINLIDLKRTYGKPDILKSVTDLMKAREQQEIHDLQNWLLD